jgi:Lipase (class 3)
MNKHHGSIKPALLAAAIAATVLASAANGQAASTAGASGTVKGAPVAQDQRTPVVSLTETFGDVGAEIFDGKTPRYSFATLPKNLDDAIVHIDVDSPQWNTKQTHAALKLARDLNWPVMAESATWDVQRLHAFVATHFPGANTKGLKNVSVRIGWVNGRPVATDVTPSEAAVEVGVDYLETTEGNALAARTWRSASKMSTRKRLTSSFYAWFANAAYEAAPERLVYPEGKRHLLVVNRDVLKVWVWADQGAQNKNCVVAWRGTRIKSWDVYRDAQLQFGTLKALPGDNTGAKFGHGYVERWRLQKEYVQALGCKTYIITGHSLGGGMAQMHTYIVRGANPILESYNSARAGNETFKTIVGNSVSRTRLYCRLGDPVSSAPSGMVSIGSIDGCSYWGEKISSIFIWKNHEMAHWL